MQPDGAFDSAGVRGLYAGRPRPRERWVDGRPTFDIFLAGFFPLPEKFIGPLGSARDTTQVMSAEELFEMYKTLWAESVSADDPSVEQRIRRWLAINPRAARKQPTQEVVSGMASAVINAKTAVNSIPFGGTYVITIVVPGIDSLVMYGRTSYRTRSWLGDVIRDSSTGVLLITRIRSFVPPIRRGTARYRPTDSSHVRRRDHVFTD